MRAGRYRSRFCNDGSLLLSTFDWSTGRVATRIYGRGAYDKLLRARNTTPGSHAMTDIHKDKEPVGEVETALLDADLFLKYGSPDRAMTRLKTALERSPRSIPLREKMREVAAAHKHPEEAARHCLALA